MRQYILCWALLLGALGLKAQPLSPCQCCGNPELKQLLKKGQWTGELSTAKEGGYALWASSFLKPQGTAPAPGQKEASYAWTCMHSPYRLQDGDPKTAWAEGAPNLGRGEVVLVAGLDLSQPLEIWGGNGQSALLFQNNARPKELNVLIIEAEEVLEEAETKRYKNLRVVDSYPAELKDYNGYQTLELPDYPFDKPMSHYLLGLELNEAYPGKKFKDLYLSELRNKP